MHAPGLFNDMIAGCRRLLGLDRHKRIFNRYYSENAWIGGSSGTGSTVENTVAYREFLSSFLKENQVKSVVDLGCGDWQFSQLIDWTGIDYLGVDVSDIVLANTRRYTRSGIRFIELDASSSELPEAHLLIAKDVIQHWSNADISRFLPALRKYRFALITNGSDRNSRLTNTDIRPGGCRPVDLSIEPFNVNGKFVYEYCADETKAIFLWKREDQEPNPSKRM